jgi:hypothetical protein
MGPKGRQMTSEPPHLNKYMESFQKHMAEVDEFEHVILKGHLIIEGVLDNVIALMLFHPEYLKLARFTFYQKLQLGRAIGLRKNKKSIWSLVLAINEVRNEVAHNLVGAKREKKINQLRGLLLKELPPDLVETRQDYPDHAIALLACTMCVGFLGTLEDDTRALRRFMDELDSGLNPDEDRVPPIV